MNGDEFWELIGEANRLADNPDYSITSPELIAHHATRLLATRPPEDIVAAQGVLDELMVRASLPVLHAAAYVINDESDDAFTGFRGWLVLQGRRAFESALTDPDFLAYRADVRENAVFGNGLVCDRALTIALDAYRKATGEELPGGPRRYSAPERGWEDDDFDVYGVLPALTELYFRAI